MKISVITPAHNEERYLGKCIESVAEAARLAAVDVEHIVVLNRCTDQTEYIAKEAGCVVVREDERNLSRIRNAGAAHARGEILVTVDADSWMLPNMFQEVIKALESGKYVGGGVVIYPERWSLGIVCSVLILVPFMLWYRVSGGLFWCYKTDFDAIGGFDESLTCVEDVDFATRLKKIGRSRTQKFGTLRKARITTSCRKFDQFGDWYFVRKPGMVYRIFRRDQKAADEFYYDARCKVASDGSTDSLQEGDSG